MEPLEDHGLSLPQPGETQPFVSQALPAAPPDIFRFAGLKRLVSSTRRAPLVVRSDDEDLRKDKPPYLLQGIPEAKLIWSMVFEPPLNRAQILARFKVVVVFGV